MKTISGLVSNTAYIFTLINATGSSIASAGTTTSPQPGTIAISQTAANSVTLSISQGIGKKIRVFKPNDGSNYDVSISDDEAMTGYKTISGLVPNTAYIFMLINANGAEESSAGTTTLQPEPPVDEDNLKLGSSGAKVTKLQENLNSLGYGCSVNGTFGTETENAVVLFQQLTGVPVTKTTDPDTRSMLATVLYNKNAGWLSRGMIGNNVKVLQNDLYTLGYYNDEDDGRFGPKTYNAVLLFKTSKWLTQDGIVENGTRNAINIALSASEGTVNATGATANSITLTITNGSRKMIRVFRTDTQTSYDVSITEQEASAGTKIISALVANKSYVFKLIRRNDIKEDDTSASTLPQVTEKTVLYNNGYFVILDSSNSSGISEKKLQGWSTTPPAGILVFKDGCYEVISSAQMQAYLDDDWTTDPLTATQGTSYVYNPQDFGIDNVNYKPSISVSSNNDIVFNLNSRTFIQYNPEGEIK